MLDLIIAGGGIAGQSLAAQAFTKGLKFILFDQSDPRSASRMAAGVINPITGRSMNKSWMVDQLLPDADKFYRSWEKILSGNFYHEIETLRWLPDTKAENDWAGKQGTEAFSPYLNDSQIHASPNGFLQGKWFKIKGGRMLDVNQWLDRFQAFLNENGLIRKEKFNLNELNFENPSWEYQTTKARHIVFCEGPSVLSNPFFNYLPLIPNRGQWRLIEIPDLDLKHITHISGLNLNPFFKPNNYYLGSTYEREQLEAVPTASGDERLQYRFKEFFDREFNILGRFAGIRPTVTDRKPLIGEHPEKSGIWVFNGMGSKGVSLSPYFADELLNHMFGNLPISREVNIKRYEKLYGH
jgi:glycine/D-amino acid oxidase-like deaminating enzyme